jgi:hypothetical protein
VNGNIGSPRAQWSIRDASHCNRSDASGEIANFHLTLRPEHYGYRCYFTDDSGKIHATSEDRSATANDPAPLTCEVEEKYLANYPFNKESTKKHHEQVVKNVLIPKWTDAEAINIDPRTLKAWLLGFDVESSTRGKYKSVHCCLN